jgi:hypothetical protein
MCGGEAKTLDQFSIGLILYIMIVDSIAVTEVIQRLIDPSQCFLRGPLVLVKDVYDGFGGVGSQYGNAK